MTGMITQIRLKHMVLAAMVLRGCQAAVVAVVVVARITAFQTFP
jgi:hypothetical protein